MEQPSDPIRTPPHSPNHAHSPQEMPNGEQASRKRRHSDISGGMPQQMTEAVHSRQNSMGSMPAEQSQGEDYENSPRARTIKRSDAPQNAEGKYYCAISEECADQIFDRKCEWSKHMDKHDRPYRCAHPQCAKLQGFTYSGGLLRHEREVHGKHGGPKSQLACPYPDCKRHSGKGFTRKENLNEHIRRVHQSKDNTQSQPQLISQKRESNMDDIPIDPETYQTPHHPETPYDGAEDPTSPANKRRRYYPAPGMSDRSASEDVENLREEVARLRADNQEKENRISLMEDQLNKVLSQLQAQQQHAAVPPPPAPMQAQVQEQAVPPAGI